MKYDNLIPGLPKTKDTIVFEDSFIPKITNSEKSVTIRNSPVSLGYKELEQGLEIEVLSCEKLEIEFYDVFITNWGHDRKVLARSPKEIMSNHIRYETVGFNNNEEMYDYYKNYLKRDFAYAITFSVERVEG